MLSSTLLDALFLSLLATQEPPAIDRVQASPETFVIRANNGDPGESPKVEGRKGDLWEPLTLLLHGRGGLVARRDGAVEAVRIVTRAGTSAPAAAPRPDPEPLDLALHSSSISATLTVVSIEKRPGDRDEPLTVAVLSPGGRFEDGTVVRDARRGETLRVASAEPMPIDLLFLDGSASIGLRLPFPKADPADFPGISLETGVGAGGARGNDLSSKESGAVTVRVQMEIGETTYLFIQDTIVRSTLEIEVFVNAVPQPIVIDDEEPITIHSLTLGLGYEMPFATDFTLGGRAGIGRYLIGGADGVNGHVIGSLDAGLGWMISDPFSLTLGGGVTLGSTHVHARGSEADLLGTWAVLVGLEAHF